MYMYMCQTVYQSSGQHEVYLHMYVNFWLISMFLYAHAAHVQYMYARIGLILCIVNTRCALRTCVHANSMHRLKQSWFRFTCN